MLLLECAGGKWPVSSLNEGVKRLSGKEIYECFRDATLSCVDDDIFSHSAALAYYTVFAIAPLFIIALAIAGFWFGQEAASKELFGQVSQLIGKDGGATIQAMVKAADRTRNGFWATSLAVITLIVASTGVFAQLENSLNRCWGVTAKPGRGLRNLIRHRLMSFAMVLGIGFLLLVSLVISAGISALSNLFGHFVSTQEIVARIANPIVSLTTITALFTMIFKILPDVKIAWRDALLGGVVTGLMFNAGKYLIGIYIARSSAATVYGAVGSLVIILAWVYYSSLILFFGAQSTRVLAERFGTKLKPLRGAVFYKGKGKQQADQGVSEKPAQAHP